ncbi:MAG TPA: hypothetical protein ENJ99_04175 [Rhizobiales bacterium]|nr:hypothetical protein [Hyphomicrobiales bacterium]
MFNQTVIPGRKGHTALAVTVADGDIADLRETEKPSSMEDLIKAAGTPGERDKLVFSVQQELLKSGYLKLPPDGIYGPATKAAILAYQKKYQLSVDGKASPRLLEHIRFTRQIEAASGITGSVPPRTDDKNPVLQVQKALQRFGYSPGKPDGVMGKATRQAIRAFERDRAMPVTGKITRALRRELGLL